ncbi:DNA-binding protein [Bifidobacterium indicum]|uniref:DNA-binding protein n=1 Tax=Bifidobacterium indicum TaxID=1691 RepID=UPI0030DB9B87
MRQATKMLGMKDEGFTKSLIKAGKIRSRKHGKTVLVSVKSIRQYMGDEPKR